ncbi:MAG TPA: hypothetical protein VEM93_05385, partial [Actinomycetota bacterium]|nr:hypothetical protein [Actinomycetota bacterium]
MYGRYIKLAVLGGITVLLSSAPAVVASAGGSGPAATVTWTLGPMSPFGGTRFDGEYVAASNRIYFLGFRTFGDATDGSIVYLNVATQTYADTGIDMPVPISNYGIAALDTPAGLGLFIFGGRTATGEII